MWKTFAYQNIWNASNFRLLMGINGTKILMNFHDTLREHNYFKDKDRFPITALFCCNYLDHLGISSYWVRSKSKQRHCLQISRHIHNEKQRQYQDSKSACQQTA